MNKGVVIAGVWLVVLGLAIAGAEGVGIRTTGVGVVAVTCSGASMGCTTAGAGAGRAGSGATAGKGVTDAVTASACGKVCGADIMETTVTVGVSTNIGS